METEQIIRKYAKIINTANEIHEDSARRIKSEAIDAIGLKIGIVEANVVINNESKTGYMLGKQDGTGMSFYPNKEAAVTEYLKALNLAKEETQKREVSLVKYTENKTLKEAESAEKAPVMRAKNDRDKKIPLKSLLNKNKESSSGHDLNDMIIPEESLKNNEDKIEKFDIIQDLFEHKKSSTAINTDRAKKTQKQTTEIPNHKCEENSLEQEKISLADLTKKDKQELEVEKPVKIKHELESRKNAENTQQPKIKESVVYIKEHEAKSSTDNAEPKQKESVTRTKEILELDQTEKEQDNSAPIEDTAAKEVENKYNYSNGADFINFLTDKKKQDEKSPEEKRQIMEAEKEITDIESFKEPTHEANTPTVPEIANETVCVEEERSVIPEEKQKKPLEKQSQYIMYAHNIKFIGKTDKTYVREFELKVAPLDLPEVTQNKSVPVIAVLKTGQETITSVSEKERVSCQMTTKDGITFMVRGIWREGQFVSKVYPTGEQLHEKYDIKEQITTVEPDFTEPEKYKAVFNQKLAGLDTEIAVFPLAPYNEPSGLVPILTGVIRTDRNDSAISGKDCTVIIETDNAKYRAYGKWENNEFVKTIEKI